MDTNYKLSKEAFVSGLSGSTFTHINLISSTSLTSLALYSALCHLSPRISSIFLVQWTLLVLPLLLAMTLFSEMALHLSCVLLLASVCLLLCAKPRKGTGDESEDPHQRLPSTLPDSSGIGRPHLPALTTYRAHMMLMTILAILAVDFPVFDRKLAKCETYGVSLMDVGVGSFVFSQGVVSSLPLLKNPASLLHPPLPKILSVTWKCLPVLVLGLVRVALVKSSGYPEHVSEYGVHWNFFITLALIPVLQTCLHPLFLRVPIGILALGMAFAQQVLLSIGGFEQYVLTAPRTGLPSANKEGIVSVPGYLSIHLLGLMTGILIIPSSPNYFKRRVNALVARNKKADRVDYDKDRTPFGTQREHDRTCIELISFSMVWWGLLAFVRLAQLDGENGVSRRMANLSYILWICAYNTSFLAGYFAIGLIFFPSSRKRTKYSSASKSKASGGGEGDLATTTAGQRRSGSSPTLFEAINKNSLVVFLLANIMTGLVNMTVKTMYTSDLLAMAILMTYSAGVCFMAWRFRNIRFLPF